MTILRKIPDEQTYYDFEDVMDLDTERFIIYGNSHLRPMGDEKLLTIVKGEYWDDEDDEVITQLNKVTGKVWTETTLRGYCQGDWQTLYYVVDEVTPDEIEEIENYYMGKVTEFMVEEEGYREFVPDDVVWSGKKAICDYLGLKEEETTIYEDDGYEKVYKYKEIT
jgi:hypothetical protein